MRHDPDWEKIFVTHNNKDFISRICVKKIVSLQEDNAIGK
jgi:hypothetical protein